MQWTEPHAWAPCTACMNTMCNRCGLVHCALTPRRRWPVGTPPVRPPPAPQSPTLRTDMPHVCCDTLRTDMPRTNGSSHRILSPADVLD